MTRFTATTVVTRGLVASGFSASRSTARRVVLARDGIVRDGVALLAQFTVHVALQGADQFRCEPVRVEVRVGIVGHGIVVDGHGGVDEEVRARHRSDLRSAVLGLESVMAGAGGCAFACARSAVASRVRWLAAMNSSRETIGGCAPAGDHTYSSPGVGRPWWERPHT